MGGHIALNCELVRFFEGLIASKGFDRSKSRRGTCVDATRPDGTRRIASTYLPRVQTATGMVLVIRRPIWDAPAS